MIDNRIQWRDNYIAEVQAENTRLRKALEEIIQTSRKIFDDGEYIREIATETPKEEILRKELGTYDLNLTPEELEKLREEGKDILK